MNGEAEGHTLQIRIQRCRLICPKGKGAAPSASVGVANHLKLIDTRGGGADAGYKGISAAAIKSIKQRIRGDR